jgi:S-DNA-T family DNA segregation ATPase FtsK/SpoIIIE
MALLQKSTDNATASSSPLPEKIAVVLQESRWLALVALAAFLGLALAGYHRGDPGWLASLSTGVAPRPLTTMVSP